MPGTLKSGLSRFFDLVEATVEKTSKVLSLLIVAIMVVTTWEVVSRYVFNHPTYFAWPINRQLFGIFILIAGAYTMSIGGHIRIEIFYEHFPPKVKLAARCLAFACFATFLVVLVWQGSWMGWNSLTSAERLPGAFRIPLYPFKLLIPLGALIFLLEGLAVFFRGRD